MVEKMETVRLYTWDQINTPGFIPSGFTNYYAEGGGSTYKGFPYTGTMVFTNAPMTTSYSTEMKMVTINLQWTNGNTIKTRQMSSLVAHNGLQDYIY